MWRDCGFSDDVTSNLEAFQLSGSAGSTIALPIGTEFPREFRIRESDAKRLPSFKDDLRY
jgi:hypothetical protein